MKKIITILSVLSSFSAMANVEIYKNKTGCTVEKETRLNGTILYINDKDKNEIVGYAKDYSFATFAYCDDKATNINFLEGSKGTGILIACSEHQNDHAITRGRVDVDIVGGQLKGISIDGQVKGLLGWKQETKIECLNLIKQ